MDRYGNERTVFEVKPCTGLTTVQTGKKKKIYTVPPAAGRVQWKKWTADESLSQRHQRTTNSFSKTKQNKSLREFWVR